jgi:hypothetical protein
MDDGSMQEYERRMRRFNLIVIVTALAALAIVIIVSWRFL